MATKLKSKCDTLKTRPSLKRLQLFRNVLRGPPQGRPAQKLVYRLIQLFSSTEIFSKRRKICSRNDEGKPELSTNGV